MDLGITGLNHRLNLKGGGIGKETFMGQTVRNI